MNIKLYNTNSARNVLDKILSNETTIAGTLKEGCDVLNPSIIVQYYPNIFNYNYCYIAEFKRYYFVTGIRYVGKTIELQFKVDVLKSHSVSIKNSVGTISRGNKGSVYLNDARIQNTAQHTLTHRKIGAGFQKSDVYVVTVAGSEVS